MGRGAGVGVIKVEPWQTGAHVGVPVDRCRGGTSAVMAAHCAAEHK